jgi:hypothetical protein
LFLLNFKKLNFVENRPILTKTDKEWFSDR